MIFDGKKKIVFLKDFTSTDLGNVWFGRVAVVKKELADKFISSGHAELFVEQKEVEVLDGKSDNTKRGKGTSSGKSKH